MRPFNQQFTLRGVLTGLFGCVIITASSVYIALKLGALPWPIFFVVLLALFVLKAISRQGSRRDSQGSRRDGSQGSGQSSQGDGRKGRPTNINEVNVSASIMSAGAMVAGGLAFTIPGIYILLGDIELSPYIIALCALSGVILGSIGTSLFRGHFIEKTQLPFPIGVGATKTLQAGDEGGRKAVLLFSSMGIAGLFTVLRDGLGLLPKMLLDKLAIPGINLSGISFGIYCSPMALAMGFMIGPLAALVWLVGGLIGNFGIVTAASSAGLWSLEAALDIRSSLGIGLMIGCGCGIVIRELVLRLVTLWKAYGSQAPQQAAPGDNPGAAAAAVAAPDTDSLPRPAANTAAAPAPATTTATATSAAAGATGIPATAATTGAATAAGQRRGAAIISMRWAPFALAAVALVLSFVVGLGIIPSLLLIALVWVVVTMAAQCTGQAGMNPMEIFGVIVLLVIKLVSATGGVEAFLVAATATVACGFVGDLMNDFKAGQMLGTSPKAQWLGVTIGGAVGAVVGTAIIALFVSAYGTDSFGPDSEFIAVQATAVASMVGGIANLPAFLIGLGIGALLYLLKAPAITLGLGVYLPFYLTLTVAVGAAVRFIIGLFAPQWVKKEDGLVIASGLLGGESIVGVVFALIVVAMGLASL